MKHVRGKNRGCVINRIRGSCLLASAPQGQRVELVDTGRLGLLPVSTHVDMWFAVRALTLCVQQAVELEPPPSLAVVSLPSSPLAKG